MDAGIFKATSGGSVLAGTVSTCPKVEDAQFSETSNGNVCGCGGGGGGRPIAGKRGRG